MVRDGLLLWAVKFYWSAADADLSHRVVLNTGHQRVVRSHDEVKDALVLVYIQAERASTIIARAAFATQFIRRRRSQHGKIICN